MIVRTLKQIIFQKHSMKLKHHAYVKTPLTENNVYDFY